MSLTPSSRVSVTLEINLTLGKIRKERDPVSKLASSIKVFLISNCRVCPYHYLLAAAARYSYCLLLTAFAPPPRPAQLLPSPSALAPLLFLPSPPSCPHSRCGPPFEVNGDCRRCRYERLARLRTRGHDGASEGLGAWEVEPHKTQVRVCRCKVQAQVPPDTGIIRMLSEC